VGFGGYEIVEVVDGVDGFVKVVEI